MRTTDVIDWSLYFAMRGLPPTLCSNLGARLAPLMGKKTHPGEHANAVRLFTRLRPDWAAIPGGVEAAVDRLWANVGRTFAEFAVSHRMLRQDRVAIEGEDIFLAATSSGRPVVAIFCHLGNWELSEMQFGFRTPHRGAVIVAPPASDARSKIAERERRKVPAELMPMSRTVWRQALAKLKTPGGGIMLAIDEEARGQVWGPSLGRPVRVDGNMGKAARLALLTNAVVMPFYNERLPGARFLTHFLPTLDLEGKASDDGAIAEAVRRMDAVMQEPVIRLLDQWYMALSFRD